VERMSPGPGLDGRSSSLISLHRAPHRLDRLHGLHATVAYQAC
jgi:hypothetical protein